MSDARSRRCGRRRAANSVPGRPPAPVLETGRDKPARLGSGGCPSCSRGRSIFACRWGQPQWEQWTVCVTMPLTCQTSKQAEAFRRGFFIIGDVLYGRKPRITDQVRTNHLEPQPPDTLQRSLVRLRDLVILQITQGRGGNLCICRQRLSRYFPCLPQTPERFTGVREDCLDCTRT